MALLFLKNFIASRPSSRRYSALSGSGNYDVEQSLSIPLTLADAHRDAHNQRDGSDRHHPCDTTSSTGSSASEEDGESTSSELDFAAGGAAATTATRASSSSPSKPSRFDARLISAATIGFSDGLTVPFALTAGLSALGTTKVVIYGGLSELVAGTISMAMGGYLGAKGEAAAYAATLSQTELLVQQTPHLARPLVTRTLLSLDLPQTLLHSMTAHILSSPSQTVAFLMLHHHHLPPASFPASRPFVNGAVVSSGYVVGGIVPLLPYIFIRDGNVQDAFHYSIGTTAIVLFAFGYAKTRVVGERAIWRCLLGGLEMLLFGGFAAAAAVACVRSLRGF